MNAMHRVRSAIEASDGTTRADLALDLDLPLGTVTTAVTGLLRSGEVVERAARPVAAARAGRPATLLVPSGPTRVVGTVLCSRDRLRVAVATYSGTVLARHEIALADQVSGLEFLEPAWRFIQERDLGRLHHVVLGVAAPFPHGVRPSPHRPPVPKADAVDAVDAAGSVDSVNSVDSVDDQGIAARLLGLAPWLHPDPPAALSQRLGVPVTVENDANLGALGEAHRGAGRERRSQIFLKLGEQGIGAGLVFDGVLHRGASGFAGEIAHIHADDGPLCSCGARGGLAPQALRPLRELMRDVYDRPLTFEEVLRLAAADEPGPARVLREIGRALGRSLADLCTFLNPELVVLDGTLGDAGRHVLSGLAEQIERYCAPAIAADLELAQGILGADAELLGALHLARAEALATL